MKIERTISSATLGDEDTTDDNIRYAVAVDAEIKEQYRDADVYVDLVTDVSADLCLTNIINDLEEQCKDCIELGENTEDISWQYEEGVILSVNNAIKIIEHIKQLEADAARYKYLRDRDLDAIAKGGLFAGMTPDNVVVNGDDLDMEIDKRSTDEKIASNSDSRYPYTYSADYLRMEVGDDYGKGLPSRSAMARLKSVIAEAIDMDDEELACKLADKYLEKYGA